jgi:hypothetical protein
MLDLDDLDRQAADEHRRERDSHREPRHQIIRTARSRARMAELLRLQCELTDTADGEL